MRLLKKTSIDFLKYQKTAFIFSGAIILIGLSTLLFQGGPKYSIDFTGGTVVQVRFSEKINVGDVRESLANNGFEKSDVQSFSTDNEILIHLPLKESSRETIDNLNAALKTSFPDNSLEFRKVETVGPKVGSELRWKAFLANFWALLGILIYVSIRFEFKYAVGAVVALIHDVLVTLTFFALLGYEISPAVIAAFLTIIGYSLNDTIVIFDRIRENKKLFKFEASENIINRSINETLSRTIITSLTVFFVVVVLFFGGGESLRYFSFAMVIGVITGSYSTVFIASPIMLMLHRRSTAKQL